MLKDLPYRHGEFRAHPFGYIDTICSLPGDFEIAADGYSAVGSPKTWGREYESEGREPVSGVLDTHAR